MKIGGVRLLTIPSALAYGTAGSPPKIAPDEALYFVVVRGQARLTLQSSVSERSNRPDAAASATARRAALSNASAK